MFARNNNLCGVGAVRRIEAPLAQALPRLFLQGRLKEALMRAARETRAGSPQAMTTFAQAWLQRPQGDPIAEARAAAALFRYGDKKTRAKALERLKPALRRKDTLAIAAPALGAVASANPTDFDAAAFCDLIGPKAILEGEPEQRELALLALRDSRVHLPAESPCAKALNDAGGRHGGARHAARAGDRRAGRGRHAAAGEGGARIDGGPRSRWCAPRR